MTDYPEDVMKAAREAYLSLSTMPKDAWFAKSVRDGDYDHQTPIKASARAILAERERAEADAASLRSLLAEAGKALAFYGDVSKYKAPLTGGFGDLWSDCGTRARTVATKIEEEVK